MANVPAPATSSRKVVAALAGIVVGSWLIRTALAHRHSVPRLFPDEYIYTALEPLDRSRPLRDSRRDRPLSRGARAAACCADLGVVRHDHRVSPRPVRERACGFARRHPDLRARATGGALGRLLARRGRVRPAAPVARPRGLHVVGHGRVPVRARGDRSGDVRDRRSVGPKPARRSSCSRLSRPSPGSSTSCWCPRI